MKLYTIGFSKKRAAGFFELLGKSGVERLIDIRLNPSGQLAGFTKKDDLAFFLDKLLGCEYRHLPVLAPSKEILSEYREGKDWSQFELKFKALMAERNIPDKLNETLFETKTCCLLCSEAEPAKCHRRLVAERLQKNWPTLEIVHLT